MSEHCPYQIDDTVYVAAASAYSRKDVACPICFGKLSVTLILGNGEHQPVECDFCGKGYEGPRGVVEEYVACSSVEQRIVIGIGKDERGWHVDTGYNVQRIADGNVFAARADAEARRIVLHADAEQEARRRWEGHVSEGKKKSSWSAGYHRRQLKELRRKAGWHEEKLSAKKKEQP